MGDDQSDEFVYKFVTRGRFNPHDRLANRDLLDTGQFYVARFEEDGSGAWLAITVEAANASCAGGLRRALPRRGRSHGALARGRAPHWRNADGSPRGRGAPTRRELGGLGPVLIACTKNTAQGFAHPGNPRRESPSPESAQANAGGHILRIDEANNDCGATHFTWDVFVLGGDPNTEALTASQRNGREAHVSTAIDGAATFSGARFACPDNICIDSRFNVWIATDGIGRRVRRLQRPGAGDPGRRRKAPGR